MTIQLEHRYRPRGGAVALFESRHSEIVVSGPAGTGKSRACLEKVHMLALLNPGMRGLLVRKTLASLTSTGLVTWREQVLPEADTARLVRFYGGSFQQLLADCNPDAPHHWLKVRADRGGTQLLESRHEDNPLLYDETGQLTTRGADYISKLDALTGVRYLRLRKGVWAAAEGLIYEDYDPAVHLIDRFPIPETWTRWWAVDFGYTNPSVIQWWAQDPDGRLYLYREIYHTKRTVDVLARQALAQVRDPDGRWTEPRPRAIVCDHDAEGRAVLERELGMSTVAATKNVTEGIQAVQARLRPAGDGRPRWFVMRDSIVERDQDLADVRKPTSTPEEVVAYIWDTAAGKPPKETPRKVDDHGMDAARYVVAEIDLAARPRIRRL
jgi:hypothetical protein